MPRPLVVTRALPARAGEGTTFPAPGKFDVAPRARGRDCTPEMKRPRLDAEAAKMNEAADRRGLRGWVLRAKPIKSDQVDGPERSACNLEHTLLSGRQAPLRSLEHRGLDTLHRGRCLRMHLHSRALHVLLSVFVAGE